MQQWLNQRYLGRAGFFVVPCDGGFSRDVQKAMYLAVQYELGMSDAEATGVFGPGTRAGLAGHELEQGSTGIWVRLFTAAMMFNGAYDDFSDHFLPDLTEAVRALQEFAVLRVSGRADYATWCQVLVSTGDPGRKGTACDCVTEITDARAQALYESDYRVVGRYLDESDKTKIDKMLRPGELATIFRNGLRVFPISQYNAREVGDFTYDKGYAEAVKAHDAAAGYGFNAGTVIYFAVDYDATQEEIASHIVPYFRGVVAGLASKGKRYVHGVYGSRNVCTQVSKTTLARWSFVSGMSYGFSGNMGFPLPENWSFNQIQTLTVGVGDRAIEIDKNIWRPGTDPGTASVNDAASPLEEFLDYVGLLYLEAQAYWNKAPAGAKPADPNELVLQYLRHEEYNDTRWRALIGGVDSGFVAQIKDQQISMVREIRDPFFGVDLKVSHLGASCNGALVEGRPSGTGTNRGDVAGWGGDLMTFYGEWRRDSLSYPSGLTYCREKLAKVTGDSGGGTFKLRDLIEDADAYNLAARIRAGANVIDAMEDYYRGGGLLKRFSAFRAGRFGGDAAAIARDMLVADDDVVISAGRIALIQSTGGLTPVFPFDLPDPDLAAFCQGFAEMLTDRAGLA